VTGKEQNAEKLASDFLVGSCNSSPKTCTSTTCCTSSPCPEMVNIKWYP